MWLNNSSRRFVLLLVFVGVTLLTTGEQGEAKTDVQQLTPFEAVGLNIFVPVVVTGAIGISTSIDFIVDTGTSRTTIDRDVAELLRLKPYRSSTNVTPSGKSVRYTALIAKVAALSQSSEDYEVLVDDLSMYSRGYGRTVGGLLGLDFLKPYILLIDFPNSQIGLLPRETKLRRFGKLLEVRIISENGLALVPVVLPTGKMTKLIFDTGSDSVADALLFKSQVGDLTLQPPIETHIVKDGNGSFLVRFGGIKWLGIGNKHLTPALVGISEQSPPRMFASPHGGMLGIFAFKKGPIALDCSRQRLMVSAPLR